MLRRLGKKKAVTRENGKRRESKAIALVAPLYTDDRYEKQ